MSIKRVCDICGRPINEIVTDHINLGQCSLKIMRRYPHERKYKEIDVCHVCAKKIQEQIRMDEELKND